MRKTPVQPSIDNFDNFRTVSLPDNIIGQKFARVKRQQIFLKNSHIHANDQQLN